jgi:4-hydroxy-3-polyprenylbenzoate decarboxylase
VIINVASFDATNKWAGETTREWGEPIAMDAATNNKTDILWDTLGI